MRKFAIITAFAALPWVAVLAHRAHSQIQPAEAMADLNKFAQQMVETKGDELWTDTLHSIGSGILAGNKRTVLLTGTYNVWIGLGAGCDIVDSSRTILLGAFTTAPPHANGFVNIANSLCFWRDTLQRAECPPLLTEKQCGATP